MILSRVRLSHVLLGAIIALAAVLVFRTVTPYSSQSSTVNESPAASYFNDLRVCVQPVDLSGLDVAAAQRSIAAGLETAKAHPSWSERGYDQSPRVEVECAFAPYLMQPGVSIVDGFARPGPDGLVIPRFETASPYRLVVFVVSQSAIDSLIKGQYDVRVMAQEAICQGNQCMTVTSGLYLTEKEVADADFVSSSLLKGLQLVPEIESSPDGLQPAGNPNAPKPEPR